MKERFIIPPTTLYTKSLGCAGLIELATVNMCVIFLLFNSFLLFAAAIEPKKRPYGVKKITINNINIANIFNHSTIESSKLSTSGRKTCWGKITSTFTYLFYFARHLVIFQACCYT